MPGIPISPSRVLPKQSFPAVGMYVPLQYRSTVLVRVAARLQLLWLVDARVTSGVLLAVVPPL